MRSAEEDVGDTTGRGPPQAAKQRTRGGRDSNTSAISVRAGQTLMAAIRRPTPATSLVFAAMINGDVFPPVNTDDVRRIDVPTLLIGGDQSPLIMHLFMDRIHELLPHAERVTIPGASHDIQVDQPSAVTEAALTFLAGAGGKPLAAA